MSYPYVLNSIVKITFIKNFVWKSKFLGGKEREAEEVYSAFEAFDVKSNTKEFYVTEPNNDGDEKTTIVNYNSKRRYNLRGEQINFTSYRSLSRIFYFNKVKNALVLTAS